MNIYKLKINKKDVKIELSSKSSKLIANEYNLFVAKLLNVDFEEVKQEYKKQQNTKKIRLRKQQLAKNNALAEVNTMQQESEITEEPSVKPTKLPGNFAQMLSQKSTEETNVIEKKTSELRNTYLQMQQLISEKHLENEVDYIVAAAYCLTHYEKLSHFTEEQIKSKITPFFDNEINHDFILDTLAKNYLKLLPDFTGTSDMTEYSLTDTGEDYFLNTL